MSSSSNDETKTATEPSTSVATSTEPTMVSVEVTNSTEAAERMITPSADRTDQVEEDEEEEDADDDDDEEEEEDAEDNDEEEEDEDMPKWDGGMPRAPVSRPVAGIRPVGGNPHASSNYPPAGGK